MLPKRSNLDWLLELAALGTLLSMYGIVVSLWPELPEQIPRHFNAAGDPNRWGAKAGIWTLPIIAAVMYTALTILSGFPQRFNVPFQIDRGDPEVLGLLRRMMMVIRLEMLLMFAYISWTTLQTALGRSTGLGRAFLPLVTIAAFAPVAYYLARLRRYRA